MSANYKGAEKKAAEILAKFKLVRPPFDPEGIAEALGVDVVYANFGGDLDDQVSGFLQFDPTRIVININQAANRKTYTIAHELGHYLLHQEYAHSQNYRVMPRNHSYDGIKPDEEKEADAFAANLLVPLKLLRRYKDLAGPTELAKLFAVSESVIINRLKWA